MKVHLVGQNSEDVRRLVLELGAELVAGDSAPDAILAYGGDGTLIGAEREFPGVPKIALRDGRNCHKCDQHDDRVVLRRLLAGDGAICELMKLQVTVRGQTFWGLNDILLRNRDLRSAVRFAVYVNDERITDEIIGDGLVASTPFGSSAYFRSIANTTFRQGIGIAFNNCTEFLNHLVLREEDRVRVQIIRGPAFCTADNSPEVAAVESGDDIEIVCSDQSAHVYGVDSLRCSHCRYKHAPRRRF